ncbi:MAG: universal stress protein [Bacteroidales bacterium]|nr:universal stress protein [Bacteroidales bacterium]
MNPTHRKILVPFDFSGLSEYAVKHAVQFAKIMESDIVFLHVIPSLKDESEYLARLTAEADKYIAKYGVSIECKIRPGKVMTAIRTFAETIDAFLIVMKTQKPIGKEKWLGSRALKVMIGSKIPFFVVQAPPKSLALRRVVFPIDFRKENKEKLSWISVLSKYYTSKIFLFRPKAHDYQIRNNAEFARRFLEGKDIDYEIIKAKGKYNITQETLEFAHEIKAEMIIIMLSKRVTRLKFLLGLKDQKYLSNEFQIPVLCLNPRSDLRKYEGFF